jgi:hypothetical protein
MLEARLGWLVLVCLAAVVIAIVVVRERWRAWWFELEDPRPMALHRIVFTFFLVCNVNGLWELFEYLFTAEGLFRGAEARAQFGGSIFVRESLLYHWDSPAAFWIHLAAFELCALSFMIGFRTRLAGVLTLVLMESILVRNLVFWEGTELVYRVFLVYLICSRSGHAYSVDNWLRARRGAAVPVYRPIPAWPRRLIVLQMAALLLSTGLAKHGREWIDGNAVYYMLSYEHLPRIPMGTVCALFGTNLLRLMTWVAHAIEVLYPLVLVGVLARWSRERFPPLSGRARVVVRACLLAFVVASTLVVASTGAPDILPTGSRVLATGSWLALWIGLWLAWRLAQRRPRMLGWLFGRRIWAGTAALLMLALWSLVNIGQFHTGMLACLLPLLSGNETHALVRGLVRAGRRIGIPIPPPPEEPEAPPSHERAYSRAGRTVLGVLLAWHVFAVAVELLPRTEATHRFRDPVHRLTHPWLLATRTAQSWGMWAPSPPRMYVTTPLKVVIVDHDDQVWDVHTYVDAPERNPVPWIFYDRSHKLVRRIVSTGADGPYARAHARWHCRRWARATGRPPRSVELRSMAYLIPTPEEARAHGPRSPTELRSTLGVETSIVIVDCDGASP